MLMCIDRHLNSIRRLYFDADSIQSVPEQDGKTSYLPTNLYDYLGHHST
jgi:hypothetical protein